MTSERSLTDAETMGDIRLDGLVQRYHPPAVQLTAELEWMIARALGPVPDVPRGPRVNGELAVSLARSFGLSARIASRCPIPVLDVEVGSSATVELTVDYCSVARRTRQLAGVCEEIAAIADTLGSPVIFLKGMAGYFSGLTPAGAREIADVDVLAPTSHSRALHARLVASGFVRSGRDHVGHHLGLLANADGLCVEIHEQVELAGRRGRAGATAEELFDRGLTESVPNEGWSSIIPTDGFQVAHAFIHALLQDRAKPEMFRTFGRLLMDLADRGWEAEDWESFRPTASKYLEPSVSWQEIEAIGALVSGLRQGKRPAEIIEDGTDAGLMLRSWLGMATEPDYLLTLGPRPTFRRRLREFSLASINVRRKFAPRGVPQALREPLALLLIISHLPYRIVKASIRLVLDSIRYRRAYRRFGPPGPVDRGKLPENRKAHRD